MIDPQKSKVVGKIGFAPDPGGKVRLQPANAAMQPIFVEPDQVQVQGVVVGVMRKY